MRITGTHIYGMLRCPHAVALDLHEDRSKRRPVTEIEEFVRKRGRDYEDRFVADLDYVEPEYDRGDYDLAAQQTEAFLREGVSGVSQGVLLASGEGDVTRLGIPDLLRREDGPSDLGDHHYVVGDIKTSGKPRSDQLLQVAFYSRMLASLQGRAPEYGYLILKDGREERFRLRDYEAAIEEVEERVFALAADSKDSEPFFSRSCGKCHWSELCVPKMEAADDLSLVPGMTRGLRSTLKRIGIEDGAALRGLVVENAVRRTHLEPVLLRRLKRGAESRALGRPVQQPRSKQHGLESVAVLHYLYDAFSERMLYFGVRYPADAEGQIQSVCPKDRSTEREDFLRILEGVPKKMRLLHYGQMLPRWFAETGAHGIESRFVDLARRLRGAAIYPGPVFGLSEHVAFALGRDPYRAGDGDGAAMYAEREGAEEWLTQKGRSDLEDLCELVAFVRDTDAVHPDADASGAEETLGAEEATT